MTKRNELKDMALALLKLLGPSDIYVLADKMGCNENAVRHTMRRLRKAGLAHIHSYVRNERPGFKRAYWMAVWTYGPGEDAGKPGPFESKELHSRYYLKHRPALNLERARRRAKEKGKNPNDPFLFVLNQLHKSPK